MKLYTIDRSKRIDPHTTLQLYNDCLFNGNDSRTMQYNAMLNQMYEAGISEHGNRYIFPPTENQQDNSFFIEAVFETVRLCKYPQCISRFQAFFATDELDVEPMAKALSAEQYNVLEINAERYEKRDMNLVAGLSFAECYFNANVYWAGQASDNPLYEYLILPPVIVGNIIASR